MAELISNTFTSYNLTDEEILQGSLLTITQRQIIQTNISMAAEEKLALEFDVTEPNKYIQKEAGLAGQIAALKYILDQADAAVAELEYRANSPTND